MSKSLGNAIGIKEPPGEMYGKLMSISDELMWRYWVFLTDLPQSAIDQMRTDVASGVLHPMQAKKNLARTITAGFHSDAEAAHAEENWARTFQQKAIADDLEEVEISQETLAITDSSVRVAKLLVALGLAASAGEATRKVAEGAVRIDGNVHKDAFLTVAELPARIPVRLGKRAKLAVIA